MKPELCLHFIWRHPVAFRDFFIPQAWGKSVPFKTRLYQVPPALAPTKVMKTGRGLGKSIELEFFVLQNALLKPNEETIISSFRRLHTKDRCETIIKYLLTIPYLRNMVDVRHINRTPIYTIPLINGNTIYGASTGDDPNATAIIGKHPSTRAIDEMEVYPKTAWIQFNEARSEQGSNDIYVGVPNGLIGMPFTDIQKDQEFKNCFFRISRTMNPFWDQERKHKAIAIYGSETADEYKQQIHGEDGNPVQGVWPIETIMRLMKKSIPYYVRTVTPDDYVGRTPEELLSDLPFTVNPCVLGIDVGYTEPTVICVFEKTDKYRLIARVNLQDKVIFDDQEEIIDYMFSYYNAYGGIDCTGGDGREIEDALKNPKGKYIQKNYQNTIIGVNFAKKTIRGYTVEKEEIEEETKVFSTLQLLQLFVDGKIEMPYDEDILEEFSNERKKKTESNRTIYTSTATDHIISAFRCFAIARFLKEELRPPESSVGYALPTWGEGISYGTHTHN
ncbi:MAG: hypothetical protein WC479_05820 [Candidatus Izemoplasmatales bacterium]